jgi:hypothetical protein
VAGTKWSAEEERKLRRFYAAFEGEVIPVDDIAALVGHSPGAVRYRAHKLGLTEPNRPRAQRGRVKQEIEQRVCVNCQKSFKPTRASSTQKTCSRSCAAKQRNMGSRGRFSGGRSRVGKRADLGDIFFRSAWEANYARYLNYLIATDWIVRWEFEPQIFRFPVKRGNRGYLPDFRVWFPDGSYEWHEVKGYMDSDSKIKLRRFALHFPEESLKLVLIDRAAYNSLVAVYASQLEGWE